MVFDIGVLLTLSLGFLIAGISLGWISHQKMIKAKLGSLEEYAKEKFKEVENEKEKILLSAQKKALEIEEAKKKKNEKKIKEIFQEREKLERKKGILEQKRTELQKKAKLLEKKEEEIEKIAQNLKEKLEKIAGLSPQEAKEILLEQAEKEAKKEIEKRILKIEKEGEERLKEKAKEILAFAVQKGAPKFVEEETLIEIPLPSNELKGRLIGKEGRNIKTFEKETGVELIVDETPNVVFLSSFDPLKREIAKEVLERLIKDGRVSPSRIEETTKKVKEEMPELFKKIGKEAADLCKIYDLPDEILILLGRLKFRKSFAQNVLQHSIEVSFFAKNLAEELGADVEVCKKAGLLHDIGKAVDWEVEGSHTKIGMKILEKYGIEKKVIDAMKSHHEEFPYESIEARILQAADAISAARPGARRETMEKYIKRLKELESIAGSFSGVEKVFAIQAGREVRVFVNSTEINDLETEKLSFEIARKLEKSCEYPGEVKVAVFRESKFEDIAK